MTKLAASSMQSCYDKKVNLTKILKMVDEAADNGAELIVFPEACLQGYFHTVTCISFSAKYDENEYNYQHDNAEVIPNGPSVKAIIAKAKERNIYVVFGMTEKDAVHDWKMYNTSVLVGPEGYIGKYQKVHQPIDELHAYYHGIDFPVYDTKIGRIGMMICYDKCFPECGREMALKGADILCIPTAWAYDGEDFNIHTDNSCRLYDLFDCATAAANQIFVVSADQFGLNGLTTYPGIANIVNPRGEIVSTVREKEGIAYQKTDITKGIFDGRTYYIGLNFLKDRHPELYKMHTSENYSCNNLLVE